MEQIKVPRHEKEEGEIRTKSGLRCASKALLHRYGYTLGGQQYTLTASVRAERTRAKNLYPLFYVFLFFFFAPYAVGGMYCTVPTVY